MTEQRNEVAIAPGRVVDCDIHPSPARLEDVTGFLSSRWREHTATYGSHLRQVFSNTIAHPRMTPHTSRLDSWPPGGGPPGSDLDFLRAQHLDAHRIDLGFLQPLRPVAASQRNLDYGAALCVAVNQWQVESYLSREPRLRGSIVVHPEHPDAAIETIERFAPDRRFAQVSLPPRADEPMGRRRYWPILAAAEAAGLPLALHVSGVSGHAPTAGGWPSYYIEEHHSLVALMQAVCVSLIFEGVFERFPRLKVILIESGIAWVPALLDRMDRNWTLMRSEVPQVRRPPSEYFREHFWFTTQPIDEPERREDLIDLLDQVGWDRVMFSSDYPHWDFDDPAHIGLSGLPLERRDRILRRNACELYGVPCE